MEDFVTFEIAKKLREKGFREECFAHYPICGEDYAEYNYIEDDSCGISLFDLCRCYNNEDSRLIDAPTISQVLKWLREEKKLYVEINMHQYLDKSKFYPTIQYMDKMENRVHINNIVYESYEDASLAGIEYVLDNLI